MFRTSALLATLLVSTAVAAPAMAQDEAPDAVSQPISITHVDLTNDANWARLDEQVAAAARAVCERIVGREDNLTSETTACEQRARDDAHAQMREALARQIDANRTRLATATPAPRG